MIVRGLLCLVAALATILASPSFARPFDEVIASKVLRVIVYENNKPFSWSENGEAKGIDVEIGKLLAQRLKVEPDIIVRIAGEKVDDDLRSNIWQGPRTGGAVGDVMLHVPIDKELVIRNPLVGISNPYYHERVVLAIHPDQVDVREGFAAFRTRKVAVQFATVAHYFLTFAEEEALKTNINPYIKFEDAAASFLDGRNAGLVGPRSQVEAALSPSGAGYRITEPPMPGILKTNWTVGTAVKHDSRDLGYAVGNILQDLAKSGELQTVFARHGVEYQLPPVQ